MDQMQLPGSHLLAALHSQMERLNTVARVCKAAQKKPHNRTNLDITYITAETQNVPLLTKEGPAVHRELCHVVQTLKLGQMESLRLPGDYKSGVFGYVMTGRLQIRTKSKLGFERALEEECSSNINSSSGSKAASSAGGTQSASGGSTAARSASRKQHGRRGSTASEEELRALFNSIDVDGSGAIDVEELRYALRVMGIDKKPDEVQELMDSVDKDGSGELEFEEFVLILTTKLGVGGQAESEWQQLSDGSWSSELTQGGCFGEAVLTKGAAQEGLLLAVEDCTLLLLEAATYSNILAHGFDGQLNAKLSVIKSCPALASCLSSRSDIRGLAYAAVNETHGWGGQLYAAGQPPSALFVIQEGSCTVVTTVKTRAEADLTAPAAAAAVRATTAAAEPSSGADAVLAAAHTTSSAESAAAALLTSPRYGLHSARSRLTARRTELAVLGPGDIAGEAGVLGLEQHSSSVLVSSAQLVVLRMELQDISTLMHPADLQHLCKYLQQREEQRQLRLCSAVDTSNTVSLHQLQAKAAAVESAAVTSAVPMSTVPTADDISNHGNQQKGSDAVPGLYAANGGGAAVPALALHRLPNSRGDRQSMLISPRSPGQLAVIQHQQQPRLQLPSTAAGAAAVIAAAGGSTPRRDLPSARQRQQVAAVSQLLDNLMLAREQAAASQSVAVDAAIEALATARSAAANSCIPTGVAGSGGVAAPGGQTSRGDISSRSSCKEQTQGTTWHVSAADLLLPHGLRKSVTEKSPTRGAGSPGPEDGSCSRQHKHRKRHGLSSEQAAQANGHKERRNVSTSCTGVISHTGASSNSAPQHPVSATQPTRQQGHNNSAASNSKVHRVNSVTTSSSVTCDGSARGTPGNAWAAGSRGLASAKLKALNMSGKQTTDAGDNMQVQGAAATAAAAAAVAAAAAGAASRDASSHATPHRPSLPVTSRDAVSVGQVNAECETNQPLQQQHMPEMVQQPASAGFECFSLTGSPAPYQSPLASAAVMAAQQMLASNSVCLPSSRGTTPRTSRVSQTQGQHLSRNLSATADGSASRATLSALGSAVHAATSSSGGEIATGLLKADNGLRSARTSSVGSKPLQLSTPRNMHNNGSNRPSAAAPVPFGVFSVVDGAVWEASQAAANDTSWMLQRQLKQQGQNGTLQADNARQQEAKGSVVMSAHSALGAEAHSHTQQSVAGVQQRLGSQQDNRLNYLQHTKETTPAGRLVPKLPLDVLQQQQLPYEAAGDVICNGGSDGNASQHNTIMNGAVQQSTVPAHVKVTRQLPASARNKGHKVAQSALPPASGARVQQVPPQWQQPPSEAAPPPLRSFRSALTTRWKAGGRFTS